MKIMFEEKEMLAMETLAERVKGQTGLMCDVFGVKKAEVTKRVTKFVSDIVSLNKEEWTICINADFIVGFCEYLAENVIAACTTVIQAAPLVKTLGGVATGYLARVTKLGNDFVAKFEAPMYVSTIHKHLETGSIVVAEYDSLEGKILIDLDNCNLECALLDLQEQRANLTRKLEAYVLTGPKSDRCRDYLKKVDYVIEKLSIIVDGRTYDQDRRAAARDALIADGYAKQ